MIEEVEPLLTSKDQHMFLSAVIDEHTIYIIRMFGENYQLTRDN